jgi:hypothetical protein
MYKFLSLKKYKTSLVEIKKILAKFVLIVARRVFWDCLIIFFLILTVGWSYYRYNIIIERASRASFDDPLFLKTSEYRKVVDFWRKENKISKEAELKEYRDLFEPLGEK